MSWARANRHASARLAPKYCMCVRPETTHSSIMNVTALEYMSIKNRANTRNNPRGGTRIPYTQLYINNVDVRVQIVGGQVGIQGAKCATAVGVGVPRPTPCAGPCRGMQTTQIISQSQDRRRRIYRSSGIAIKMKYKSNNNV